MQPSSRPSTAAKTPRLPQSRQSSASHRRQLGLPPASADVQPKLVTASLAELFRRPADLYHSKILQYEEAYATMLVMVSDAAAPNPLRTAFASAVLHTLIEDAAFFPEGARNLLRNLKNDVLSSVFIGTSSTDFMGGERASTVGPSGSISSSSVFSKPQFAGVIESLRNECETMKASMQTKAATTKNEARLMEAIVSRWQRMLVDRIFQSWRNFVKRRPVWLARTESHLVSRDHRQLLRQCLIAWKAETVASQQAKIQQDTQQRFDILQQNEASLVKEYSRVVTGVEKLQMEKRELHDFIRRQTEELTSAKLLIEQLNARLEQARNATNNWKEVATHALRLFGSSGERSQSRAGSVSVGAQSGEARLDGDTSMSLPQSTSVALDFTSDVDVDSGILQAVNRLLEPSATNSLTQTNSTTFFAAERRQSSAHSPKNRKASSAFVPRTVVNFTTDFSDGQVLTMLAMSVGALDRDEGRRAMDELSTAKMIELALTKLEQHAHVSPPMLTTLDLQMSSQPEVLKLFLIRLMSVSTHACPLCSATASRSESRRASTVSTEGLREALLTASDIRHKLHSSVSYFHNQRRELHKWESQVAASLIRSRHNKNSNDLAVGSSQNKTSFDGFVDMMPLLRSVLQRAAETEVSQAAALHANAKQTFIHGAAQALSEQVHLSQLKLWELFRCTSPASGSGLVVDKLATLLNKTKLVGGDRFKWSKKQTVLLFDFLCSLMSQPSSDAKNAGKKQSLNASQLVAAIVYWVAAKVLQSLTEPSAPALLICDVGDTFAELLPRLHVSMESTGRDELRELSLSPVIAAVLDHDWETVALHCFKFDTVATDLTLERFAATMKECKMISSTFTAESAQSAFCFVADDPQGKKKLDMLGQRELIVAVACVLEPALWKPVSERVATLLKRLGAAKSRDKGRIKPKN